MVVQSLKRISTAVLTALCIASLSSPALAKAQTQLSEEASRPSSLSKNQVTANQVTARSLPNGQVYTRYIRAQNPVYQSFQDALQSEAVFDGFVEPFSEQFLLPRNITVVFQECGTSQAYYQPESSEIVMCYELLESFVQTSLSQGWTSDEAGTQGLYAFLFVLYHEMGHAFIHDLNLPVVGSEEDAADNFATFWSMTSPDSQYAAWAAAYQLLLASSQENPEDFGWDTHDSSLERANQIICLSYGADPSAYQDIPELILPAGQEERCVAAAQSGAKSFLALLEPHWRY
jgi:hypothetical protein